MAPKSKKRVNEYESDDGFVVDGDAGSRGAKKAKTTTATTTATTKKSQSSSSSSSSFSSGTKKTDSNGDVYWNISSQRRITLSDFRGKTLVNIREYYEKDGQDLPGKKGISLSIDQFTSLINRLPEIEQELAEKGVLVPRPSYKEVDEEDNDDQEEEDEDKPAESRKKNIDATSDEDEDDE